MISDYRDQQQKIGSADEAYKEHTTGLLKQLHTCLPGIVFSFDAATQTAQIQPAIQRVFNARGPVNLPMCVDVPVCFPGGGDIFLTFPVQPGDECTLFFSERCIDFWHVQGGVQLPADYRMHDLSDAFAFVGVNSQPNKLANVNTAGAELRTRDRSVYIRLEAGGIFIKGNIVQEGNITSTGVVTGTTDVVFAGRSAIAHVHTGVDTGPSNTGAPL